MGKWEMVRLGDVGTIITGNTPPKKEAIFYDSNDIPFFKPNDFSENTIEKLTIPNEYVSEKARKKIRLLPIGSVLVTCIGTIGKVGIVTCESTCNQQINAIIPHDKVIISEYLANAVLTRKAYLKQIANAPVVPIINKSNFSEVQIPLPPIDEQKRIAKNLDLASEIVKGYKGQLAELDKLVQSVFYEMFDSFIGDKSTYKPLPKVANFIDYRGKTPEKSDAGIPLITAKNVKTNSFSLEPQEFIPQNTYEAVMTRGFPRINDVLFTTEAPLGNVCRIPNIFNRFVVGQRLITMQPIEGVVNSEYLEFILSSKEFQAEMMKRSSGSTVKGIRSKELVQLSVSVPPFSFQTRFASIVTEIESQKAQVQQALTEAESLFNSLMQEYFE